MWSENQDGGTLQKQKHAQRPLPDAWREEHGSQDPGGHRPDQTGKMDARAVFCEGERGKTPVSLGPQAVSGHIEEDQSKGMKERDRE